MPHAAPSQPKAVSAHSGYDPSRGHVELEPHHQGDLDKPNAPDQSGVVQAETLQSKIGNRRFPRATTNSGDRRGVPAFLCLRLCAGG